MISRINTNYSYNYCVQDTLQMVHVYESAQNESLEIDLSFVIAKDGKLEFTPLILGHGSYKIALTFILEDNANAAISGAYALTQDQRCNVITRQYHLGKNSVSNLAINGIAKDSAFTDYRGMIRIEKSASGTQAHQENKTILIGSAARAISIPSIEVFNHDVSCAHGSAIGPLDAQQLLYARARGMAEAGAKKMLVRSIFMQMLARIDSPEQKILLVNQLTDRIIGE